MTELKNETRHDGGLRRLIFRLYDRAIELIILGVIPLMLVALGFAFLQAVVATWEMIPFAGRNADEAMLRGLVEQVLEVVILIELFNTFMEYARTRHIRLANLLDVTIVFALRELLIQLYAQVISAVDILTLCVLVIVLVIARSIAARFGRQRPPYEDDRLS
ncbi:MAG TPA: phosphate-starvation-inducible PsiE family protein [Acidocella sp.]|uniref:phosphate-starvation-inducible PsiE family protein n=1 Tax=Acidocella sp. TaxID=50710 RepID=UPI002B77EAE6|nr:phosphate-starvation-inducible PsiE family protein [Acidocella sp.]HVE23380.1 phosphate-starvation-inducible PsiE family protein [Acidocella sp.]